MCALAVILASTSPRRQALLTAAGVEFALASVQIDETWQAHESAKAYIERMVYQKAVAAVNESSYKEGLFITADTIGVLADGSVLTKPVDKADAFMMWDKLSDNTHEIWTAVCVSYVRSGQVVAQRHICECTQVDFVSLTQAMKERYWQTGEPADKAGAYAIQGGAMAWVRAIRGSYTNVVGLPLAQTLALLQQMQAQFGTEF